MKTLRILFVALMMTAATKDVGMKDNDLFDQEKNLYCLMEVK